MNLNRHKLIQIAKPLGMTEGNFRKCLDGRKTQTRRVIKPTPVNMVIKASTDGNWYDADCVNPGVRIKPRYKVGDICYLSEPVQIIELWPMSNNCHVRHFWAPPKPKLAAQGWDTFCRRDLTERDLDRIMKRKKGWDAPTTARFMLKSFARHFVEITGVRAERLQDIALGGICKEGLSESIYDFKPATRGIDAWVELWNSINPKENTWDDNPWVWVFSFETVEATS